MKPSQQLEQLIQDHSMSPFLFIGSGFSQRYLGIPTWEGLLRLFCNSSMPFEYYFSRADSSLPKCASLLAEDFAEAWWKDSELTHFREKHSRHIRNSSSPLKLAIADCISNKYKILKDARLTEELDALRALNIEGIITTNWDGLLESLFPDYQVYIGQKSVIRQTPQNIAEIYKIHGCCSDPNSLVLTEEDYNHFRDTQAYLAAKLITIFVEHPVVFIGYSISDPNILDLLKAVLRGLGSEEVAKLQRNLIFVQRAKEDRPEGVKETLLVVDETHLPITNLVTDDFLSIYTALAESKLKLPARILRFCKEQLFEIVSCKEPSDKLCLLNIDEIEQKEDIEFVVGIGVASGKLGDKGYTSISPADIFEAAFKEEPLLDARRVLDQAIPTLDFKNNFLPVFRFLSDANLTPADTNASVQRLASLGRDGYKTKSYERAAIRYTDGKEFSWILDNIPPEKVAVFVPFLPDSRIDLDLLRAFIEEHFDKAFSDKYSTLFRKLFCLYDFLRYGQKQGEPRKNEPISQLAVIDIDIDHGKLLSS